VSNYREIQRHRSAFFAVGAKAEIASQSRLQQRGQRHEAERVTPRRKASYRERERANDGEVSRQLARFSVMAVQGVMRFLPVPNKRGKKTLDVAGKPYTSSAESVDKMNKTISVCRGQQRDARSSRAEPMRQHAK